MKKILFAALMLTSVSVFASDNKSTSSVLTVKSGDGRHIPASDVPNAVINSFNNRFPNASNVQWEVEREHGSKVYQAEFTQPNGNRLKAQFAPDGTFLGKKRA